MGPTVMLAIWEQSLLQVMDNKLRERNFNVVTVEDDSELVEQITNNDIDVILLDIRHNEEYGLHLMTSAKKIKPGAEVILIRNPQSITWAMEGMQAGAFDDITEPFEVDELSDKILAAWKSRKKSKWRGRGRLAQIWEKTMMAAAYAEAGDFDTAISLTEKGNRDKGSSEKPAEKKMNAPAKDPSKGGKK